MPKENQKKWQKGRKHSSEISYKKQGYVIFLQKEQQKKKKISKLDLRVQNKKSQDLTTIQLRIKR
jgi:hypothetical protein